MSLTTPTTSFKAIRKHARWVLVAFFLALSYFAASNLSQKYQDRKDALVILTWTQLSVAVNDLVHELQKERGLSSGYVASHGTQFRDTLLEQRRQTELAIVQLAATLNRRDHHAPALVTAMAVSIPQQDTLDRIRHSVSDVAISREVVVDRYSVLIESLFEQLLNTMNMGKAGWIYRQQMSFIFFLQAKEMAGQERALVTAMLTARDFGPVKMNEFHRIRAVEQSRIEKFSQLAEAESLQQYQRILNQSYVRQADRIRRLIVAIGAADDIEHVRLPAAEQWFALVSQKIDAMSDFEAVLGNRLVEGATHLEADARLDLLLNALTVLISFSLAGILIVQIRRGEQAAESNLQLGNTVFGNSTEAIIIAGPDGTILEVNDAFCTITGYSREEAIGKNPRILKSGAQSDEFYRNLWRQVQETGHWEGEIWNRRKNGEKYPTLLSIVAVKNAAGKPSHYIGMGTDLSHHKETEALVECLRTFDPLTGLPNSIAWLSALDRAVADAIRQNHHFSVITLGIDRFKRINDSLSHTVGDAVLVEVARRLRHHLSRHDIAARLDGDHFSLILPNAGDFQSAAAYCEGLLAAFVPPVEVEEHSFDISLSMGVAIFPMDGDNARSLRKNSEAAMYRNKEENRGRYTFYSSEMNTRGAEMLLLERLLREALEKREFSVFFQPQLAASDGRLVGVEALIRWSNPELGMVPPMQFIPIAEESGLIAPIGEWVLREACREIQALRHQLGIDLTVAVNLSARQFRQADLMVMVQLILDETRLPSRLLELEITEGLLMADPTGTTLILDGLRQMGIRIALDDFGTGYSSLAYLKNFPIDRLKIDRAFVKDLPHSDSDRAIARTVIALGLNLGMEVLAEGVETQAQVDFLLKEGCHTFQGFHYGKPMPAAQLMELIGSGHYRV